jgi:transglutaminase-like putative cysteine protease
MSSTRPDARFLRPHRFVESNDPEITALADNLRGDSSLASGEAIYDWARTNLSYAGYVADELGARNALEHRRGNCA